MTLLAPCRHKHTCRVSSHVDLQLAASTGVAMASVLCCERPECRTRAAAWVARTAGVEPFAVWVVPWPRRPDGLIEVATATQWAPA